MLLRDFQKSQDPLDGKGSDKREKKERHEVLGFEVGKTQPTSHASFPVLKPNRTSLSQLAGSGVQAFRVLAPHQTLSWDGLSALIIGFRAGALAACDTHAAGTAVGAGRSAYDIFTIEKVIEYWLDRQWRICEHQKRN
jgi:hypothetical protein